VINPSRLALARQRQGMSVTRLAALTGLSRQTLLSYDSGKKEPTAASLALLQEHLKVSAAFLTGSDLDQVPPTAVSFRAMAKMTAGSRDRALAAGRMGILLHEWIGDRFKVPAPDVPTLGRRHGGEGAAELVRARWDLGQAPIKNMQHLLEARGVKIFSLPSECADVDAFSLWWQGTPYISLTAAKTAERRRFDLAHEFGHIALHGGDEACQGKIAEAEANRFAAALLMPRASLLSRPLRNPSLQQLLAEKRRWGVSAMALAHRLSEVGMLTEWEYRSLCVELSRRGYRRAEVDRTMEHESSQLLAKVLAALGGQRAGLGRIAEDLALPVEEVRNLVLGQVVTAAPLSAVQRRAPATADRARLTVVPTRADAAARQARA
jgi:Zn-dependent peptidase ImmA (M78 family)/transcriptional regulator with XRE-family HTH domain